MAISGKKKQYAKWYEVEAGPDFFLAQIVDSRSRVEWL